MASRTAQKGPERLNEKLRKKIQRERSREARAWKYAMKETKRRMTK